MIWMRPSWVAVAVLASVAVSARGETAAPVPGSDEIRGTYRLHGTARVGLGGVLERDVALHADAVLERGARAGEVLVRVDAEGYGCDLVAQVDAAGALAVPAGQQCAVRISSPDARGRLAARLRSGRGRVGAGRLSLELAGDVEGALQRRTGGVRVLGQEVPRGWTPELPIHGPVAASAEGTVDRSRAAQR